MEVLTISTRPDTSLKARPTRGSRVSKDAAVAMLVCGLAVLIWLPRLRGPIDFRWDAGTYYVLGTSLVEGKGYTLLNEPGEIEETQYPPVLPAFIAAHQWILGTTDPTIVGQSLRYSYFLIFVLYTLTVYWMLRKYLSVNYAFLATVTCLFVLHNYFLSDLAFPEIPFALCTTLFFLCNRRQDRGIFPVLAAVFALTAYGLRTMGIALLAAWVGESLLHKQYGKTTLRLSIALIPLVLWQSYIKHVESGPRYNNPAYDYQRADYMFYNVSYANNIFRLKDPFIPELGPASLQHIAYRFLSNLTEIPMSVGGAVSSPKMIWELPWKIFNIPFPIATPWPVYVVMMTLGCLVIGGIGLQLASRQSFVPSYVLLSICLMCLTPWPAQFARYLTPLAPFLALLLFQSLLALKGQFSKVGSMKWNRAGAVLTTSIVLIILVPQLLAVFLIFTKGHQKVTYVDQSGKKIAYRLWFYNDSYRVLDAGLDWLKKRAQPDDVLAVSMPHWVYLRTGLKTVMPPFELDPDKAQRLLNSVPVKYLILDHGLAVDSRKYMSPVMQKFPHLWTRIYSASILSESGEKLNVKFEIYERVDQ